MADKMIFQRKWYDAIKNDEYIETTDQEMAYILYAAMIYSFEGERIDIGEVFGAEFKGLNRSMPNIYSQIDNIKDWSDKMSDAKRKYDPERIKELRLQGYKAREICEIEGYDVSKANNITSNRGNLYRIIQKIQNLYRKIQIWKILEKLWKIWGFLDLFSEFFCKIWIISGFSGKKSGKSGNYVQILYRSVQIQKLI